MLPRYPVFVPSKGRWANPQTARMFLEDRVPFRLVVEPSEADRYREAIPEAPLLVTPRDEMRLVGVRNWIRDVSEEEGHERHWQFDDNIRCMRRWHENRRVPVAAGLALRVAEDFTDRYENVGITGFDYAMFGITPRNFKPYRLNVHVYSTSLIWNRMPYRWRLLYNDDTDLCLQVLAGGLCTVQLIAFLAEKMATMSMRGGNTDDLYQGDGRIEMARMLERNWPGVVTVYRRWSRPAHKVNWRAFRNPLKLKPGVDPSAFDASRYAMELRPTGKSGLTPRYLRR
jgi:hypothetical protein